MNSSHCKTEAGRPSTGPADVPPCWSETTQDQPAGTDGWKTYWEKLDDRQVVFRVQSDEYVENLARAIPFDPGTRVLDFGCGFGYVAERLAPRVGELFLWDGAANMRRQTRARLAPCTNVRYLDLSAPENFPSDLQLDFVLINSVVQYMTPDEFSGWLAHWRQMLAPTGRVVVSDLIPPDYSAGRDLLHILKMSARRGILLRAVYQAAGEIFRYYRTRQDRPLTRIGRDELTRRGEAAGFSVAFLPRNLTHFPDRITAVFSNRSR